MMTAGVCNRLIRRIEVVVTLPRHLYITQGSLCNNRDLIYVVSTIAVFHAGDNVAGSCCIGEKKVTKGCCGRFQRKRHPCQCGIPAMPVHESHGGESRAGNRIMTLLAGHGNCGNYVFYHSYTSAHRCVQVELPCCYPAGYGAAFRTGQ